MFLTWLAAFLGGAASAEDDEVTQVAGATLLALVIYWIFGSSKEA